MVRMSAAHQRPVGVPSSARVASDIWRLTWPILLANLSVVAMGLVDTALLGHLESARYMAAVAIGSTVVDLLLWGFGFLRMSTTALTARALGARDEGGAWRALARSAVLAGLLGALLIVLREPLMAAVNAALDAVPEVERLAALYAGIRIVGSPASLFCIVVAGWFVGRQRPGVTLILVAVANLVNLALDVLFILGLGMRVEGAALAALIADYTALAVAVAMLWREWRRCGGGRLALGASRLQWERAWRRAGLGDLRAYRELLRVNGDLFLRTLCLQVCFVLFLVASAGQGTAILAANNVLLQLLVVASLVLDSPAHALEALAGWSVGAQDRAYLRRVVRSGLWWCAGFALLFSLTLQLLAGPLPLLFSNLPEVVEATRRYYQWLAWLPLVACWCFALDGVFIGAGQTRAMRNIMVLTLLGAYLPAYFWLRGWDNAGLWLALYVMYVARGVAMLWLARRLGREDRWF